MPLLALPALAACSVLPERPYAQRQDWPLQVPRPAAMPAAPRPAGGVLLLRGVAAAPGLDSRGLHRLRADGSMAVDYYDQWLVAPADGVEDSLRAWLAASGLFSSVVAPGSRLPSDQVLEVELTALWTEPGPDGKVGAARARLAWRLLQQDAAGTRLRTQGIAEATAPLQGGGAAAEAAASKAALAECYARMERAIALNLSAAPRRR